MGLNFYFVLFYGLNLYLNLRKDITSNIDINLNWCYNYIIKILGGNKNENAKFKWFND